MLCKRLPTRSCCDPLGSSITDRLRLGTAETGQPIAAGPGDDASAALDEGHGAGTERIRHGSRAIGADRRTAGAARGVARVERAIGLDRPVAIEAADAQVRTLEQRRVGFEADRAALDRGHGDIGRIADRRDGDARPGRNDRSGLGERGGSDDDRQGNGNGLLVEERRGLLHGMSPFPLKPAGKTVPGGPGFGAPGGTLQDSHGKPVLILKRYYTPWSNFCQPRTIPA